MQKGFTVWFTGLSGAGIMDVTLGGSVQPVADFLKLLTKQNTAPASASRGLHLLAPLLAFACAVVAFAVIPFGSSYGFGETTVALVLADPDAGVLVLFVVGTVGALAPLLAGAGSGSARAAIGGLRAGAQMVSYRVVMAFALLPMLMIFGTLALGEMGTAQDEVLDLAGIAARLGLREPLGLEALPWVGRLGVPA